MISGLHQQAVVSIEEPEKGKRKLMAQNDIGIDRISFKLFGRRPIHKHSDNGKQNIRQPHC